MNSYKLEISLENKKLQHCTKLWENNKNSITPQALWKFPSFARTFLDLLVE